MSYTRAIVKSSRLPIAALLILALLAAVAAAAFTGRQQKVRHD